MKNLVIEPVPASALVRVAYEGGGEVPDELKGWYMTPRDAKEAIEVWRAKNPERELDVVVKREEEEKEAQERAKQRK